MDTLDRNRTLSELADALLNQDVGKLRSLRAEITDLLMRMRCQEHRDSIEEGTQSEFNSSNELRLLADLATLVLETGMPLLQYKLSMPSTITGAILQIIQEARGCSDVHLIETLKTRVEPTAYFETFGSYVDGVEKTVYVGLGQLERLGLIHRVPPHMPSGHPHRRYFLSVLAKPILLQLQPLLKENKHGTT